MNLLNIALPLASSLLSLVFAGLLLQQWRQRRRAFQLVWALGLLWYAIAAGTEFTGAAFGWNESLYRAWYLFGAFFVAAYLGVGTVYLLARTSFGYFAAVAVLLGGLLSLALSRRYPGSFPVALTAFLVAAVGALAIGAATALRRGWAAHLAMGVLAVGSLAVAGLVLTAPVTGGYALDPATGAPVASALPGYVRVLTGPFNVAGALCLVFGAGFSTYVYMPKRKLLAAGAVRMPVLAQLYYFCAVVVNLVASLPGAIAALVAGRLHSRVPATILIALGGFIPSVTSGLSRFGITWSFFLGEFLGVLLIFLGFLVSEDVFQGVRVFGDRWRGERVETAGLAG